MAVESKWNFPFYGLEIYKFRNPPEVTSLTPMFPVSLISLCAKSLQSCLTLCDLKDYRLPSSSVHGILQVRIPEWVVISSYRGFSQLRD